MRKANHSIRFMYFSEQKTKLPKTVPATVDLMVYSSKSPSYHIFCYHVALCINLATFLLIFPIKGVIFANNTSLGDRQRKGEYIKK